MIQDVKALQPMKLLRYIKARYPDYFAFADKVFQDERSNALWDHRYSRINSSTVLQYFCNKGGYSIATLPAARLIEVPLLKALTDWRYCKNVYDFDPTLTEALFKQATKGIDLSLDLVSLPAYAVYIRPNFGDAAKDGFFVYWDEVRTRSLYFLTVSGTEINILFELNLSSTTQTLEECLEQSAKIQMEKYRSAGNTIAGKEMGDFDDQAARDAYLEFRDTIAQMLSLVLYLTAVNAEVVSDTAHPVHRSRKVSDSPHEVKVLRVGEQTGLFLRSLKKQTSCGAESTPQGGHHRSPITHIRMAHWHTYHTGSQKLPLAERKTVLKWIPPLVVNGDGAPPEFVTVNRVADKKVAAVG